MYPITHYPIWESELGRPMGPGAFGENLSVEGLDENSACIGDVLAIGAALLEVSQPRQPCATLARRHQVRDMIELVHANGRSGWYLRVLTEGALEAGQTIRVVERPNPTWPVRRAAVVMRARRQQPAAAAELAGCRGVSPEWRSRLTPR
jgi:MOSC domain-containing protein YiiM